MANKWMRKIGLGMTVIMTVSQLNGLMVFAAPENDTDNIDIVAEENAQDEDLNIGESKNIDNEESVSVDNDDQVNEDITNSTEEDIQDEETYTDEDGIDNNTEEAIPDEMGQQMLEEESEDTVVDILECDEANKYNDTNNTSTEEILAVEEKIDAIGDIDISNDCKERIDAAREAYDALTEDQKALVSNYSVLTAAENAYEDLEAQDENIIENGDCGELAGQIKWVLYTDGELKLISHGEYMMKDYGLDDNDTSNAPWSAHANEINKVTIDGELCSIGDYAFANCSNIESVNMNESVTRIGMYAFLNCTSLTDFINSTDNIPCIENYEEGSFKNCENLSRIPLSIYLQRIDDFAFYGCKKLKCAVYNNGTISSTFRFEGQLMSIGVAAFWGCESIAKVEFPSSIKEIKGGYEDNKSAEGHVSTMSVEGKWGAFSGCTSLQSVTFKVNESVSGVKGIEKIGDFAFYGCQSLSSVRLVETLNYIGCYAFADCTNMKTAVIEDSGVDRLEGTFMGCTKLEKVTIGTWKDFVDADTNVRLQDIEDPTTGALLDGGYVSSIHEIGQNTFGNCIALTDVEYTSAISDIDCIGNYAFDRCRKLSEISLPAYLDEIGNGAFASCDELKYIVIPNGTKKLGTTVFYDCKKLEHAYIPTSLETIGPSCFDALGSVYELRLADIYYQGNKDQWDEFVANNKCLTTGNEILAYEGNKYAIVSNKYFNSSLAIATPQNVKVEYNGGILNLSWEPAKTIIDPATGITVDPDHYEIYMNHMRNYTLDQQWENARSPIWEQRGIVDGSDNSWTYNIGTSLTEGDIYHFRVRAILDDIHGGMLSGESTFVVPTIDTTVIADVENKIAKIGKVVANDTCKERIDAAREAYDALTEDYKALVSNYSVLTAAETKYAELLEIPTNYTEVEDNGDRDHANTVVLGNEIRGTIDDDDEYDFYKFTLDENGNLSFNVKSYVESCKIRFYNSYGTIIYDSDPITIKSGDEYKEFSDNLSLESGTYYLCFTNCYAAYTGDYSINTDFTSTTEADGVKNINFEEEEYTAYYKNPTKIPINVTYDGDSSINDIELSSTDNTIASVTRRIQTDENGNMWIEVTGEKEGTATITASTSYNVGASFDIEIVMPEVRFDESSISMFPNSINSIGVSTTSKDANYIYSKLNWNSSDEGVVRISYTLPNGAAQIMSSQKGTAVISVSVDDIVLAECTVTVEVAGKCGENAFWVINEDGVLTISGTGELEDRISGLSSNDWGGYYDSFSQVVIEDGITSIGDYFFCYSKIKSIEIPASVTRIGKNAFYQCTELTSIKIPYGVTEIEERTFCECYSLVNV